MGPFFSCLLCNTHTYKYRPFSFLFFFFFYNTGFEFRRVSHLLCLVGRRSTSWATPPAQVWALEKHWGGSDNTMKMSTKRYLIKFSPFYKWRNYKVYWKEEKFPRFPNNKTKSVRTRWKKWREKNILKNSIYSKESELTRILCNN
jgi:hypothetical protein